MAKPDQSTGDTRVDPRAGAERVARTLRGAGHQAYFVGGCVRDLLMGSEPDDYDIATDARPEQVEALFARAVTVGASFGVVKVREERHIYEIATFRTDGHYEDGRHPTQVTYADPEEDARRRDFTINGLFYDPLAGEVIDWVDGQADLKAKTIRAIGDPRQRFAEDYLRLLRAVRFAARFGFEIEPVTRAAVIEMAPHVSTLSAERIRDELVKMFRRPGRGCALRLLYETGLLKHVLPEIEAQVGCEQPEMFHPEGDVFVHTALVLDSLPDDPSPALAMGALLHDVAKPRTRVVDETGRARFNQHAEIGAEMAAAICQRMRFSNDETTQIVALVKHHMRFMHVTHMREAKLKRFLRQERFDEHLELHRADCRASHGDTSHYDFCREKLATLPAEEIRPPRLITGHDLIAMGLAAGPRFREILTAIEDAQLEGRITTREQALARARELAPAAPPQSIDRL